MDIDELAKTIRSVSPESVVQKLADILIDWKSNPSTARELEERIERYIGNTWIKKDGDHETIYSYWSTFRDNAIHGIGGMTMNERLYWFGLFDEFDKSPRVYILFRQYLTICGTIQHTIEHYIAPYSI